VLTDSPHIVWVILFVLASLVFLLQVIMQWRTPYLVRPLPEIEKNREGSWPKVTLIVPASNEAVKIGAATLSKLESDYQNLEVILVDDRSSDGTGTIIDQYGKLDPRVKTVHIRELPGGWLGKPHALHQGVKHASGEIFLFTDADVHFSKDVISRAVSFMEDKGLDHLGMVPRFWTDDFLLNVVLLMFVRGFVVIAGYWGLDLPWLKSMTGVGAFNMVRRKAFEKTKGFEWLKMDIADDVALARMVRDAGGKSWVAAGDYDLDVEWYGSIGEFARGIERPIFSSLGNFSLWETWVKTSLVLISDFFMFVVPFLVGTLWMQWVCVFLIVAGISGALRLIWWGRGNYLLALFWPVGTLIFAAIWFRAGWVGWRRGGVEWRGTVYPSKVLKKGRRIRIV